MLSRREFLTLVPLGLVLSPWARASADAERRTDAYEVAVGIFYNALGLDLTGTLQEAVDRAGGHYEMKAEGQGSRIANRVESRGIRRHGRWAPVRGTSWFQVAGRESRTEILYDYERRRIDYHFRGETFVLRRLRVVDDTISMPDTPVDDAMSALLNYADGVWPAEKDGTYRTHIVRRSRPANEGPDDVQAAYRAELAPFVLRVQTDRETGRPTAVFDLTRFSSWARESRPGKIVFGEARRPEQITASLILGTSVSIRFKSPA